MLLSLWSFFLLLSSPLVGPRRSVTCYSLGLLVLFHWVLPMCVLHRFHLVVDFIFFNDLSIPSFTFDSNADSSSPACSLVSDYSFWGVIFSISPLHVLLLLSSISARNAPQTS